MPNTSRTKSTLISLSPVSGAFRQHLPAIEQSVPLIWPHLAGTPHPWEAVTEHVSHGGSGAVYAILADRTFVGITGWYWRIENPTNAGLRWTGILPGHRRRGYFRAAVDAVMKAVARQKREVRSVSEIIPRGRKEELLPVFLRLGFEECPDFANERSPEVQGTDYLADGVLVTKEMTPSRLKASDVLSILGIDRPR